MTKEEEAIKILSDSNILFNIQRDTALSIRVAIETVLNMLKKKDNQIDLMADFIRKNITENKLINEICIKGKCQNEECHEDDWKDCIKQYFERKVNHGN